MVLTKIWERYFVKEMLKTFLLFVVGFYGLYALVDYATHSRTFNSHHNSFQWEDILVYYCMQFVEVSEVLIPFGLLLATIKTLCQFNIHNELVALMTSGLTIKRLMRPFLFMGCVFTALMYLNTEFILPKAMNQIKFFETTKKGSKALSSQSVKHIMLEDRSTILFQEYDSIQHYFFDAYWIRSVNDIYRIKYLYPNEKIPIGYSVDHFTRDKNGDLVEKEVFDQKIFPSIKFNKKVLFETITTPDEQSYIHLWNQLPKGNQLQSEKEAEMLTVFYSKLAMPWFCLLAVLVPIPLCIKFTRHLQTFFIYAISIFGLVGLFLVMDAALVLGKRQVLSPFYVVWVPFFLAFSFIGIRYLKIVN